MSVPPSPARTHARSPSSTIASGAAPDSGMRNGVGCENLGGLPVGAAALNDGVARTIDRARGAASHPAATGDDQHRERGDSGR